MVELDLENFWIFTAVTVVIWVAVYGAIEVFLLNGELLTGVIQGLIGGVIFATVYRYVNR
ncbi:MAG: hypothetical protein ABEK04_04545 [Candidatus Nanohalobium sp.]